MIEEALQQFESGNYGAAEALYRKMLEDEPDNPQVLFMLSLVRQQLEDLDESLGLLQHALRVQPKNPTLLYSLGNLQLRRKQVPEAERAFHAAVGVDPNFVAAQNGIAMVELSRGRFAAAEHTLRKALKSEPDNPQTLLNMGIAVLEQNRAGDAVAYLQQSVAAEPDNAVAQLHLGRALLAADNSGFAVQCFENVLAKKPGNIDVLGLLAQAQTRSRQFAGAVRTHRQLLSLGVETPDNVAGLARSLIQLGRDSEAEGVLLRALRLNAGDESLLLDLAGVLLRRGEYSDVSRRLGARLSGANDLPRMTCLLAEARLMDGDAAGAIELLRPVLSQGAPSPAIRLLFAKALLASGERDAADAQVDRLLEMDPPPVEAVMFRARELFAAGNHGAAIEHLRGIQRRTDLKHEERQAAVALLADALHANGNYKAAWEQSLGLSPRVADVIGIRAEKALQLDADEAPESAMHREVAWSWPPEPPNDGRPEPVFVFAWPGSGRLELLRALAAHTGIRVIEDQGETQRERRLVISHPQGAGPLNRLSPAQIQLARRKYWKNLNRLELAASNAPATAPLTVDAMWLTAESLPTLYRLFPQARLITLEQDPRDLAASWLRSGYRDLEQMAELYSRQLELLNLCRLGVPLNYINIDARRLQDEPGKVLREAVSALSIAWEPSVERAWAAVKPHSDLASAGGWKNYETWLEPVYSALAARPA